MAGPKTIEEALAASENDVGGALTGHKFLTLPGRGQVDDRRNKEWWDLPVPPMGDMPIVDVDRTLEPLTTLEMEAGGALLQNAPRLTLPEKEKPRGRHR